MWKNRGFQIALVIMLILAGINNWRYFAKRKTRFKRPQTAAVSVQRPVPLPELPVAKPVEIPAKEGFPPEKTKKARKAHWGRNPFLTPWEMESLEAKKGIQPDTTQKQVSEARPRIIKIDAIIISDSEKVAIIGNNHVREGDRIGEEQVLRILPSGIILGSEKGQRVVTVENSSLPIEVEER